ncbi:MAG: malonic semialdehyde reductase [Parvibaculum sp.]|nr:malonic semialdehyde reductase [Parvibaculum sp.]
MNGKLGDEALDVIFRAARTHNAWQDKPVSDALLKELYDLMKWGPTSANMSPARIVFVTSKEAKEKLAPALMEGNRAKTLQAPVTAIIGYDVKFYERLPELFPHAPEAKTWFNWSDEWAEMNAFRNGSLQGAYFMIAARSLGLDCGPMSGFDMNKVDELFFAGTSVKSNFLCNLGYGDPAGLFERSPRLPFDDACSIV